MPDLGGGVCVYIRYSEIDSGATSSKYKKGSTQPDSWVVK